MTIIFWQIFLNGVTYCDMFPADNNSLCVSGLAGGRLYEIVVEVYGKKPDCTTQKSSKLVNHKFCFLLVSAKAKLSQTENVTVYYVVRKRKLKCRSVCHWVLVWWVCWWYANDGVCFLILFHFSVIFQLDHYEFSFFFSCFPWDIFYVYCRRWNVLL